MQYSNRFSIQQIREGGVLAQFARRPMANVVALWMTDQYSSIIGFASVNDPAQTAANLSWSALSFVPDFMRLHVLYADCVEWTMPSSVPTWRGVVREFVADMSSYDRADVPADVQAAPDRFVPLLSVDHAGRALSFTAATRSGTGPTATAGVVPFVYAESTVLARTPETQILFLRANDEGGAPIFASPRLALSGRATSVRACMAVVHKIRCSEVDLSDRLISEWEARSGVLTQLDLLTAPSHIEATVTFSTLRLRARCPHSEGSAAAAAMSQVGSSSPSDLDEDSAQPLPPLLYIRSASAAPNATVLAFNLRDISVHIQRLPPSVDAYVRCNETAAIRRYTLDITSMLASLRASSSSSSQAGTDAGGTQGADADGASSGALAASEPQALGAHSHSMAPGTAALLAAICGVFGVFMLLLLASHVSVAKTLLGRSTSSRPRSTVEARVAETDMSTTITFDVTHTFTASVVVPQGDVREAEQGPAGP